MKEPIIFLAIAIGIAVLLIAYYFSLERKKRLQAYAASQGWQFSAEKDKGMRARYPSFKCLRRGHSRWAYNIMRGSRDQRDVTAFDYHYVTGHGKHRRVHNFSALVVQSPLPLKSLYIRPENIFDKVSDFFGADDIDFESAEFSRKFYVTSPDKRWAFDVIHQQMMEYLLAAPKYSLQFDSGNVIAWKSSRFKGPGFDEALGLIKGMLDRLPEYLFRK